MGWGRGEDGHALSTAGAKARGTCQDSFGKALQERMGGLHQRVCEVGGGFWLCPRSFLTSHSTHTDFGDQDVPGVGWTGLMGHVPFAALELCASARCHLERSEPCVGPQWVFPGSAQCQQQLLHCLP